jgi:uncharacterized protein
LSGRAVVTAVYEAFGAGDLPGVLAHFDPAIEWRLAEGHPYSPAGEAWIGHDAVVERFFARAAADWDGFRVDVTDLHEAGDTVVAQLRYSGTFRANRRALDAQGCHVWTLRDGRIMAFQQYVDTQQLQVVMRA